MVIVKIGGGEGINLQGIIEDLAQVREKFIIVHGANALRTNWPKIWASPRRLLPRFQATQASILMRT